MINGIDSALDSETKFRLHLIPKPPCAHMRAAAVAAKRRKSAENAVFG
jgi:hypothetical protein